MVTHPRNWRFIPSLFLTVTCIGFVDLPAARASHICNQPGIECTAPVVGPWDIRARFGVSNDGGIFPISLERFATEGAALAAGRANACLPPGDTRLGYIVCSCEVTSDPQITTLVWWLGVERLRGSNGSSNGNWGIATYQLDYSLVQNCLNSRSWEMPWYVQSVRTVACPAEFGPDSHDPPEVCWRYDPCQVPALTEMTDPVALGFESGNRWRPDLLTLDYQTKLSCVQNGITARDGAYANGSAYRPTQYQRHLFEIIDRDNQLNPRYMSAHPECRARRATISSEMSSHELRSGQLVAPPGASRHESGTAFDITPSGLSAAQLNAINANCGVTHTAVPGEPWHHQ